MSEGLLQFETLQRLAAFRCFVSPRGGGESAAPYASLNLGFSVGDDARIVVRNRERLFEMAGVEATQVVSCRQVHGATVARVGPGDGGRGALSHETAVDACDGLLTTTPGLHLLVQSADCPLVAIFAPPDLGVAAVHSGWKGTAMGVVPRAVQELEAATRSPARTFQAVLAPAIGDCCYEVGPEVLAAMEPYGVTARPSATKGHGYLSLRRVIRRQLEAAGVAGENIEASRDCTRCRHDMYFSYRHDGARTGRFALLAGLRGRSP